MLSVACGGREGAQARADVPDGAVDGATESSTDAGWTQCASPDGLAVCGGPSQCPNTAEECGGCTAPAPLLGACQTPAWLSFGVPKQCGSSCADGTVCVADYDGNATLFFCSPYDLGVLFAQNGAATQVRYADMAAWTGTPLPLPESCPSIPGIQFCGGNCGACPQVGDACTGRAPLHPYSFCAPPSPGPCSAGSHDCGGDAGGLFGCLTFTVEPDAQQIADRYGLCLPVATCQSVAANLPGGATCSP
jgi:hypothetical protein